MTEVDWNEAARQWEQLVKEQEEGAAPEGHPVPGVPRQNPYDLPGCLCIAFGLSWFGLTVASGDWLTIVCAFGTIGSLWWIGSKESSR